MVGEGAQNGAGCGVDVGLIWPWLPRRMTYMAKSWTLFAVGVWVLISPWLLGFADISIMKWSNLICGTMLIVITVWDLFGERSVVEGSREGTSTEKSK